MLSMDLQPRQIAKVVYEAIRAYDGTLGQSDRPHWEGALQSDRDDMLNRVDAFLRGQPYPPASIRPSDQCKARILAGIIGAFVLAYNPPIAAPQPPVAVVPPPPPIPVEKFEDPDASVSIFSEETKAEVAAIHAEDRQTVPEAMAQADANIAAANEPAEAVTGAD